MYTRLLFLFHEDPMKKKGKKKENFFQKYIIKAPIDINLVLVILFLNIFGIIMIYSASYYYAVSAYNYAPTHFMKKQIIYVFIGFIAMFLLSYVPAERYEFFCFLPLLLAFVIILCVRVPGLGHASHGAYRWINIFHVNIQIAEPVKLFCIAFLASFMTRYKITKPKIYLFIFGVFFAIAALLLFVSNNMSTAMIVFLMMFFTFFIMYPKQRGMIILMIIGISAAIIGLVVINRFIPYKETENFRITRIRAWLNPTNELYADDEAYQAMQARYAIGSGGFFGKGLGKSLIKFKLPEPHNDYILSIVFEELGIFGVIVLTFLYIYLFFKIFMIYVRSRDRYSRIFVLGVFFHLALQVLMNYAVTLGFLPTMGVTLPFISAGGSSATLTLAELGVVLSVDRMNTKNAIYEEAETELQKEDPYYRQLKEEKEARQKVREQNIRKKTAAKRKAANR